MITFVCLHLTSLSLCLTLTSQLQQIKAEFETAKAATAAMNAELNKCSTEIKALHREQDKHLKEGQAKSLEARKLAHKLKEWEKESKDAAKLVNAMIKQHPWIEKEKAFFGQTGSDFDFQAKDVGQCSKRHKELKVEQVCLFLFFSRRIVHTDLLLLFIFLTTIVLQTLLTGPPDQEDQQEGDGYDRERRD